MKETYQEADVALMEPKAPKINQVFGKISKD